VAHHVARDEVFYATSLDEALPADVVGRYAEACRRFDERLRAACEHGADRSILYVHLYGAPYTPDEATREVLILESSLLQNIA